MTISNDRQDLIVYGALGLSFLALIAFKGGDFLRGINEQSQTTATAAKLAKDNKIAETRIQQGCSTGFIMGNGAANLVAGEVAYEIRNRTPYPPGTCLMDEAGATGLVDASGVVSDLRVSSKARDAFIRKGFRLENEKVLGGQ